MSDTVYTITGQSFRDITVTTNSKRFSDNRVKTDSISPDGALSIALEYKLGLKKASRVTVKDKEDGLMVSDLSIAPRVRAKGVPRFTLGIVYGIALWAEQDVVWGLVDYSRPLEEMLINAGFPAPKVTVSEDTSTMYFEARLDQIDYDDDNFAIVRQ